MKADTTYTNLQPRWVLYGKDSKGNKLSFNVTNIDDLLTYAMRMRGLGYTVRNFPINRSQEFGFGRSGESDAAHR